MVDPEERRQIGRGSETSRVSRLPLWKDALATPQQSLALQTGGSHPIIGPQSLQDPFRHEQTSHHALWAIVIPRATRIRFHRLRCDVFDTAVSL